MSAKAASGFLYEITTIALSAAVALFMISWVCWPPSDDALEQVDATLVKAWSWSSGRVRGQAVKFQDATGAVRTAAISTAHLYDITKARKLSGEQVTMLLAQRFGDPDRWVYDLRGPNGVAVNLVEARRMDFERGVGCAFGGVLCSLIGLGALHMRFGRALGGKKPWHDRPGIIP